MILVTSSQVADEILKQYDDEGKIIYNLGIVQKGELWAEI